MEITRGIPTEPLFPFLCRPSMAPRLHAAVMWKRYGIRHVAAKPLRVGHELNFHRLKHAHRTLLTASMIGHVLE
jgi:hypothetical protein